MSRIPEEVLVLSEARWWIAGPSELSPTDIYVLHRCQQSTWILLVPFVKMKMLALAVFQCYWSSVFLSPQNTQCSPHYAYTVSVEQTLLMKGRLAYGPQCRRLSQKWCLSSLIYLHSLSLFSPFLFSSSLSLFVETSMQPCPLCRKLSGAAVSL